MKDSPFRSLTVDSKYTPFQYLFVFPQEEKGDAQQFSAIDQKTCSYSLPPSPRDVSERKRHADRRRNNCKVCQYHPDSKVDEMKRNEEGSLGVPGFLLELAKSFLR